MSYKEWFSDCGEACLVMEYCSGGDPEMEIEKHQIKRTRIEELHIVQWTHQMSMALEVSFIVSSLLPGDL